MKWNPITRRHFLQGLGGAALSLPLLPSLMGDKAYAAVAANQQKTFVGLMMRNGLFRSLGPKGLLMPQLPLDITGVSGFTSMSQTGRHPVYSKALSAVMTGGQISPMINSAFNPILPKMTMMQGFDYLGFDGSAHHNAHLGNPYGPLFGISSVTPVPSIDQVMAHSKNFYKNPQLVGTSVAYSGHAGEISLGASSTFKSPGNPGAGVVPSPVIYSPLTLWQKFFGPSGPGGSIGSGAPTKTLRSTLVDRVLADYKAVRNGRMISSIDRQILDQHVAFLQSAQQQATVLASCSKPAQPAAKAPSGKAWGDYAGSYADRQALFEAMNSVIVSLIACGLCHVFAGHAWSMISANNDDYHAWSHAGYDPGSDAIADAAAYTNLTNHDDAIMRSMFLDLALKLDAMKLDSSTSLLDVSLIAAIQEHSMLGHQNWNVPIITAGSAGGAVKTGLYIDFRDFKSGDDRVYNRTGYPISQAWANMLQALDVPAAEYEAYNVAADADALFKIGTRSTGYGPTKISAIGYAALMNAYNTKTWGGHDLSSPLPFWRS